MSTRFHQGQTGSLTWSLLNEVMDTTDRAKQGGEEAGAKPSQSSPPVATQRPRFFLVHAVPSADNPEHYDWTEIAIDKDDAPIITAEALQTAKQNFRSGSEEDETYGICLTAGWVGGFALCKAQRKTNGVKQYILCPVADAGLTTLQIVGVADEEFVGIGIPEMSLYMVSALAMSIEADEAGKPTKITTVTTSSGFALNLAEWGNNIPPTNSGATYEVYPIQPGTRVFGRKFIAVIPEDKGAGTNGGGEGEEEETTADVFFFSLMPRLEANC